MVIENGWAGFTIEDGINAFFKKQENSDFEFDRKNLDFSPYDIDFWVYTPDL